MKEGRISGIYCWTSPIGKKYTAEMTKNIVQLDRDGNFIKLWNSSKEAGVTLFGKTKGGIVSVCNGQQESAYGYKWKYVN